MLSFQMYKVRFMFLNYILYTFEALHLRKKNHYILRVQFLESILTSIQLLAFVEEVFQRRANFLTICSEFLTKRLVINHLKYFLSQSYLFFFFSRACSKTHRHVWARAQTYRHTDTQPQCCGQRAFPPKTYFQMSSTSDYTISVFKFKSNISFKVSFKISPGLLGIIHQFR